MQSMHITISKYYAVKKKRGFLFLSAFSAQGS